MFGVFGVGGEGLERESRKENANSGEKGNDRRVMPMERASRRETRKKGGGWGKRGRAGGGGEDHTGRGRRILEKGAATTKLRDERNDRGGGRDSSA